MNRLYNSLLFLIANTSRAEKNLELIMLMLQSTTETIKNIKSGMDSFQASVLKMTQDMQDSSSSGE